MMVCYYLCIFQTFIMSCVLVFAHIPPNEGDFAICLVESVLCYNANGETVVISLNLRFFH